MSTTARDNLTAFYAAHPDIPNADGERLLALPVVLLDELDMLLAEAAQERTIGEHVAQCAPCRGEFGPCVTFLPDGTVRCDLESEDGWDSVRYDTCDV